MVMLKYCPNMEGDKVSIRKRLFLSNAAMVLMPIFLFIIYFVLLNIVFNGDLKNFGNNFHQNWQQSEDNKNTDIFHSLSKISSLHSEKLLDDHFLQSLTKDMKKDKAGIAIRKGNRILYKSSYLTNISNENIPEFGKEGYSPFSWIGHNQYSVRQHDFYFKDGSVGSLFLLNKGENFASYARRYFPLIFLGIVIILVGTNALLSYFMSRSILRPVKQLTTGASKISKGNLNFQLEPSSKDELGDLVKSFDNMRLQLKESLEHRERLEANRKELIANISHDLKTPITSIKGYVEGILDGVANTEQKLMRYLQTIHVKAEHMDHLIDELSLYSKLDVKTLPFYFENVNINAFLKDYIDELKLEYRDVLDVSFITENSFIVSIDRDKIIRVMNNIIRNSMKYNDKEICKIDIMIKDRNSEIIIAIKDNGPGISSEDVNRIFHRFYRTDPSRNSITGGSGLGLAIAEQIIIAHGGIIWAESNPGEGLTIYFTLLKPKNEGDEK
ncbi:MAG: sensor histidine kinase [Heyndrickxia sp.]